MASFSEEQLNKARNARRESRYVEFKERFDPQEDGEWCELVKDFLALANSGGGVVVVGVRNNGDPSGEDLSGITSLDPAKITDKTFRYTGINVSGFEVHSIRREGRPAVAIVIDGTRIPVAFTKAGTYRSSKGKDKCAFRQGTIYFRHGAKSEPASTADIQEAIERSIDREREVWLGGLRKVVEAPPDTEVAVVRRSAPDEEGRPTRIQIATDEGAAVYGVVDPDDTHPFRQTELVKEVNKRLPRSTSITRHDIQAVRRIHDISDRSTPDFCHLSKWAMAPQYSEHFVDWLIERHDKNEDFFQDARARYRELLRSRKAPRQ